MVQLANNAGFGCVALGCRLIGISISVVPQISTTPVSLGERQYISRVTCPSALPDPFITAFLCISRTGQEEHDFNELVTAAMMQVSTLHIMNTCVKNQPLFQM